MPAVWASNGALIHASPASGAPIIEALPPLPTAPAMTDRILALHRVDLEPADRLLAQLRAAGDVDDSAVVTVFDPVLQTYGVLNGHPRVQLMPLPFCEVSTSATPRAWAATRVLCAAIDELMAEALPEAVGAAWCGHWLQFVHLVSFGWQAIARQVARRLPGDRLHVLLPEPAYTFGFHSFLPGLVLSDQLRSAGVEVKLYGTPMPAADPPLLPDLLGADGAAAPDLLCHLPTCFYDGDSFVDEIRASGRRALVLPAQFYDTPTTGLARCPMVAPQVLTERLPATELESITRLLARLETLLVRELAPRLPAPALLHKQVAALLQGFRQHALVYFSLQQCLGARPPRTLLLSNHEGGYHGALLSFARQHGVQTLMVPHSKIFNVPVKSRGHAVQCLTHPLQGGDVVDLNGDRLPVARLDFREPLRQDATPPRPLAVVGVVLNALSDTNMLVPDLSAYVEGLRRLRQWCAAQGVDCRIRSRPNGSALVMLSAALGMTPEELAAHQGGGIADFGRGCDLVVGYDTPTSGCFELLAQGLAVVQASSRRLGPEEWSILDEQIAPQHTPAELLARLAAWHADPLALWRFRRDQQAQLAARRADALPLRHWLQ